MLRTNRLLVAAVLIVAGLQILACGGTSATPSKSEPAEVEPVVGTDLSRVAAIRATWGVMSALSAIMRWLTGSMSRKLSLATETPAPESRVSSNSMSGRLTRS